MMTKTEQNMLDMARESAKNHKRDLDRLQENINNLKGYLKVYETFDNTSNKEIVLCETILRYLKYKEV